MNLQHAYWFWNSEISKENCEKLISLGEKTISDNEKSGIKTIATTAGNGEKGNNRSKPSINYKKQRLTEDEYVRDSKICWLDEKWVYDLIIPYITSANNFAGWKWNVDCTESVQFTKYETNGFYGWHTDGASDHPAKYKRYIYGVSPEKLKEDDCLPDGYVTNESYIGKVRKLSMSINLSPPNSYEGGDFEIEYSEGHYREKRTISDMKNQGSVIVFPSFTPHCVMPITKGTRYSIVVWMLGEPWK